MQFNNIPPFVRFLIAAAMFVVFFFSMIEWVWLDPIIKYSNLLTYFIVAVWAALIGGVCYALLPTKKTIQTTTAAIKKGGKINRVVGYWLWLACFISLFCGALALYINEM